MIKFVTLLHSSPRLGCRSLVSIGDAPNRSTAIVGSKRQQFKAIAPDKRVLDYLDTNQLGYCAKRRVRVALARKYAPPTASDATPTQRLPPAPRRTRGLLDQAFLTDRFHESPYPFHRPGRAVATARDVADLPAASAALAGAPEVALVGRSNVGKSTLLNALLGLEAARAAESRAAVSDKPGETQQLHFYGVGRTAGQESKEGYKEEKGKEGEGKDETRKRRATKEKEGEGEGKDTTPLPGPALAITDMPGFGFAFLNEADAARCRRITAAYLLAPPPAPLSAPPPPATRATSPPPPPPLPLPRPPTTTATRPGLKRVLLLVDARHGLKAGDVAFLEELFGRKVVLTKSDLVERSDLARRLALVDTHLRAALGATRRPPGLGQVLPAVAVAAADYKGLLHLKQDLARLLPPRPAPADEVGHETEGEAVGGGRTGPRQDLSGRARPVPSRPVRSEDTGQGGKAVGTGRTGPQQGLSPPRPVRSQGSTDMGQGGKALGTGRTWSPAGWRPHPRPPLGGNVLRVAGGRGAGRGERARERPRGRDAGASRGDNRPQRGAAAAQQRGTDTGSKGNSSRSSSKTSSKSSSESNITGAESSDEPRGERRARKRPRGRGVGTESSDEPRAERRARERPRGRDVGAESSDEPQGEGKGQGRASRTTRRRWLRTSTGGTT